MSLRIVNPHLDAMPDTNRPGTLYRRSERSLMASGAVTGPAAGATLASIDGSQFDRLGSMYAVEYWCAFGSAAGNDADFQLQLDGSILLKAIPVPGLAGGQAHGRLVLAPNGYSLALVAPAGKAAGVYLCSLIATRLTEGVQAFG